LQQAAAEAAEATEPMVASVHLAAEGGAETPLEQVAPAQRASPAEAVEPAI